MFYGFKNNKLEDCSRCERYTLWIQAHIDMYLDMLILRFDVGRADIAQNLHSMGEKIEQTKSTSALLSEDLMPLRRFGNTASVKPISFDTGIPTRTLRTIFANCPGSSIGELNRLHSESCKLFRSE